MTVISSSIEQCQWPVGEAHCIDELTDLRAEVERLKRSDRIGSELLGQTRIDLSNALAKNERLSDANADLRMSNDNLRSLLAQSAHGENERLRAVLETAHAAEVAMLFHDTYERLAPTFGYETREETRQFDPTSPNGALMIAVAASVLRALCQT